MRNLLLSLDFMGITPFMLVKGSFCFKSTLGGIISILVALSIFGLGMYFSILFITRDSFTLYTNNEKVNNSTRFWKHDDFSIIVLDKYFNAIPNSDRIFSIYADIWTDKRIMGDDGNMKSETVIVPVELTQCDLSTFDRADLWRDEKLINQSTCFSKVAEEKSVNSTGVFGGTGYTGVVFWIHLCNNSTNKTDCYPYEESKKILENVFVYVKFSDYYFNHNSINNFSIPYIYSELIQASSTNYKRQWYLFQNTQYISDSGILFDVPKTQIYTTFSSTYSSYDSRTSTTIENTFLAISLNMEDSQMIVNRRYYKIQNLFADLGGIIKVICIIGGSLDYLCSYNLFFLHLINENINHFLPSEGKINDSTSLGEAKGSGVHYHASKIHKPTSTSCSSKQYLKKKTPNKLTIINKNYQKTTSKIICSNSIKIGTLTNIPNLKKKNRIKLKGYHLFDITLILCPYRHLQSLNKNKKMFSRFEMIICNQMDVSNIISNQNLLEKLSLSLVGVNNYKMFERCFNALSILKSHLNNKNNNIFYPNECITLDNIIMDNIKLKNLE